MAEIIGNLHSVIESLWLLKAGCVLTPGDGGVRGSGLSSPAKPFACTSQPGGPPASGALNGGPPPAPPGGSGFEALLGLASAELHKTKRRRRKRSSEGSGGRAKAVKRVDGQSTAASDSVIRDILMRHAAQRPGVPPAAAPVPLAQAPPEPKVNGDCSRSPLRKTLLAAHALLEVGTPPLSPTPHHTPAPPPPAARPPTPESSPAADDQYYDRHFKKKFFSKEMSKRGPTPPRAPSPRAHDPGDTGAPKTSGKFRPKGKQWEVRADEDGARPPAPPGGGPGAPPPHAHAGFHSGTLGATLRPTARHPGALLSPPPPHLHPSFDMRSPFHVPLFGDLRPPSGPAFGLTPPPPPGFHPVPPMLTSDLPAAPADVGFRSDAQIFGGSIARHGETRTVPTRHRRHVELLKYFNVQCPNRCWLYD